MKAKSDEKTITIKKNYEDFLNKENLIDFYYPEVIKNLILELFQAIQFFK